MKKTFRIEVDCAVCANKVETSLNKLEHVNKCSVNFMTQKLEIDYHDDISDKQIKKDIKKYGKKVDSDFDIIEEL